MNLKIDAGTVDKQFFNSLIKADIDSLGNILTDDFILVDVMSGSVITKTILLAVIGSGDLKFESIDLIESNVRIYQSTTIIVGRTLITGKFKGNPFTTKSRYTHVYIEQQERWRLASAQGTQIIEGIV